MTADKENGDYVMDDPKAEEMIERVQLEELLDLIYGNTETP